MSVRAARGACWLPVVALLAAPATWAAGGGERLWVRNCRPCHAPGQTGHAMLARRQGDALADLAQRGQVAPELVRLAVRHGLNSMPHIGRGSVSDEDLEQVIAYLNRGAAPATGGVP